MTICDSAHVTPKVKHANFLPVDSRVLVYLSIKQTKAEQVSIPPSLSLFLPPPPPPPLFPFHFFWFVSALVLHTPSLLLHSVLLSTSFYFLTYPFSPQPPPPSIFLHLFSPSFSCSFFFFFFFFFFLILFPSFTFPPYPPVKKQ